MSDEDRWTTDSLIGLGMYTGILVIIVGMTFYYWGFSEGRYHERVLWTSRMEKVINWTPETAEAEKKP